VAEVAGAGRTVRAMTRKAAGPGEFAASVEAAVADFDDEQSFGRILILGALLSFKMPRWQAEGLIEDYAHYVRGEAAAVSSDVEKVTGKAPRDFRGFVAEYKAAFE
jgi:hypothetical protein